MTSPAVSHLFDRSRLEDVAHQDEPVVSSMNWRTMLVMGVLVFAYLLLGGVLFQFLEQSNESSSHDGV
uniref:Small integral membrane protein 8 n=1 Tax=Macrostomum lignano TaxID=282301 RepID=A0A1I8HDA8_9PLAT